MRNTLRFLVSRFEVNSFDGSEKYDYIANRECIETIRKILDDWSEPELENEKPVGPKENVKVKDKMTYT